MTGRYLEDFAVGQAFRFGRLQIDESRLLARYLSVSCAYPRQKSSRTFNRTRGSAEISSAPRPHDTISPSFGVQGFLAA